MKILRNNYQSKFYNGDLILELNKPVSVIYGGRGNGKSTYYIKNLLYKCYDNGWEMVLIRRSIKEISNLKHSLKTIIEEKFPDIEVNFKSMFGNYVVTLDEKVLIYIIGLRSTSAFKSTNFEGFPKVKYIVFDEFIADSGQVLYKDEFTAFQSLLSSVIRHHQDKHVILVGNDITKNNPYVDHFLNSYEIPTEPCEVYVYDDIVIEKTKSSNILQKEIMQTAMAVLTKGNTDYREYLLGNKGFSFDNDKNIRKDRTVLMWLEREIGNVILDREGLTSTILEIKDGTWQFASFVKGDDITLWAISEELAITHGVPLFPSSKISKLVSLLRKQKVFWNSYMLREATAIWLKRNYEKITDPKSLTWDII